MIVAVHFLHWVDMKHKWCEYGSFGGNTKGAWLGAPGLWAIFFAASLLGGCTTTLETDSNESLETYLAANCGNGKCQKKESCSLCPEDCGSCSTDDAGPSPSFCGDDTCDADEDCSSCEADCGACQTPSSCGDGTCDADESCSSCSADCGSCSSSDVCGTLADACHSVPLGDSDYCSDACPCGYGEGDCDGDSDCQDGLECEHNIGADFGRDSGEDLCVLPGYPSNQDQCSSPEPEPSCGDGTCDAGEDCVSCESDCGACQTPSSCGDGTCDSDESCSSCSADCGACPEPSTGDIEGFGAQTLGADGCSNPQTYRVTTLSDSGSGSFRDAISAGCRHIVFDVGGTITLSDSLSIEDSFITIDGSTAPAPGITFDHGADHKLNIKAGSEDVHDIIARYLRHVGPGGHPDSSQDFWGFDAGSSGDIYNVALEHLTLTGATDGIFDFNANEERNAYYNITLAYNFIHTQYRAASIRGPKNITVHHNVWARVDDRGPKYSDQAEAHHINNVHYQWGYICHRNDPHGLSLDSDGIVDPKVLAEYNYLQPADTPSCGTNADDAVYYRTGVGGSQLFLRGNHLPPEEDDTSSVSSSPISVPSWAAVTVTPVNQLGDALVPCAGTHYPTQAERDLLDEVSRAVGGQGGTCQ